MVLSMSLSNTTRGLSSTRYGPVHRTVYTLEIHTRSLTSHQKATPTTGIPAPSAPPP